MKKHFDNMKKKIDSMKNSQLIKMCGIILLLVLLVLFIFIFLNNREKEENNGSNSSNNNQIQNIVTNISTFDIVNFKVQKNTPNKVNMVFKLINKSEKEILNKSLDINMYQNNKIIYTYHYLIENLKVSESIYVQANASFNYKKIDRFEFVIDEEKIKIEPTYVD